MWSKATCPRSPAKKFKFTSKEFKGFLIFLSSEATYCKKERKSRKDRLRRDLKDVVDKCYSGIKKFWQRKPVH